MEISKFGNRLLSKLINIYKEFGSIIICYDFDDTVYNYSGYNINGFDEDIKQVAGLIREAHNLGCYTYVFTDLHSDTVKILESYLTENDIPYDSVNECPAGLPFGNNGKPYYNILLDDKAGLGEAICVLELFIKYINEQR